MRNDAAIRVLIADDDLQVLETYESMLDYKAPHESTVKLQALSIELFENAAPLEERRPIKTTTCSQGDQAVSLALEAINNDAAFDAVVLDIKMPPGISGLEAAHSIRLHDSSVPIFFVTGFSGIEEDDLRRQFDSLENIYYFTKPVQFIELANTIAEAAK